MKTIFVVRNSVTAETFVYEGKDLVKAQIALDYLNTMTPYHWRLEREALTE